MLRGSGGQLYVKELAKLRSARERGQPSLEVRAGLGSEGQSTRFPRPGLPAVASMPSPGSGTQAPLFITLLHADVPAFCGVQSQHSLILGGRNLLEKLPQRLVCADLEGRN